MFKSCFASSTSGRLTTSFPDSTAGRRPSMRSASAAGDPGGDGGPSELLPRGVERVPALCEPDHGYLAITLCSDFCPGGDVDRTESDELGYREPDLGMPFLGAAA